MPRRGQSEEVKAAAKSSVGSAYAVDVLAFALSHALGWWTASSHD